MKLPDEDSLSIHKDRLDDDAEHQPKLMFRWGTELAAARRASKEAKARLKVVVAEVDRSVRASPGRYGLDKITEAAVTNIVVLSREHAVATQALIEAEYQEDMVDAYVKALNDRKGEIEVMSRLHGQMYWSKPDQTPKDQERVMREASARTKVKK